MYLPYRTRRIRHNGSFDERILVLILHKMTRILITGSAAFIGSAMHPAINR